MNFRGQNKLFICWQAAAEDAGSGNGTPAGSSEGSGDNLGAPALPGKAAVAAVAAMPTWRQRGGTRPPPVAAALATAAALQRANNGWSGDCRLQGQPLDLAVVALVVAVPERERTVSLHKN